jgi:hypothetical protein
MKALLNFRMVVMLSLLILAPIIAQAQTDKKAADLKKLETGIATAKAKVSLNERQIAVADSLVAAGNQLILDSKAETKTIAAERKKLDKDYGTQQKSLSKLTTSKDKEQATQAKADLKALDTKYKADTKALDNRLKDATKKSTTGTSNVSKGKTSGKTAHDALKTSLATLDAAQAKYDAASGTGETVEPKGKKKK